MSKSNVTKYSSNNIGESVVQYENVLRHYLSKLGLPQDNILVSIDERKKVILNLPSVIKTLDNNKKLDSIYLSKFCYI